jgi:hypothetical protein
MKNFLKLLYVVLPLTIIISMFIYSCQKEQIGADKLVNQNEQSIKDYQLERKILSFRDKIDLIRGIQN